MQQRFNIHEFRNNIYLKNHIPERALGLEYGRLNVDPKKGREEKLGGCSKFASKARLRRLGGQ